MRYPYPTGGSNQAGSLTKKMVKSDRSEPLSLDLKISNMQAVECYTHVTLLPSGSGVIQIIQIEIRACYFGQNKLSNRHLNCCRQVPVDIRGEGDILILIGGLGGT